MEYKLHGMDIYYESIGSGLPVIMIHGNGPDHRALKGCMEPCFAGYDNLLRRIYFDLPGYGKTKGNAWLSNVEKMFELIADFIDGMIQNQPFILVGNSYGGYLARGILKKKQNLVKGLLLLCPSHAKSSNAVKPSKGVFERDTELDAVLTDEEKLFFEPAVFHQTIKVWLRYKEEILPGLKLQDNAFCNTYRNPPFQFPFEVDDLEYPLEEPALIIMGKQDSIVGYCNSWNTFKDYPRASLVILDNAGHSLQIEQPELFTSLTKEWLERIMRKEKIGTL